MKHCLWIVLIGFSILRTEAQTNTERSLSLIGKLERGQYDSCQTMFDTVVSNKINADMMRQIWESLPRYMGEYKSYGEISTTKKDSTESVIIRCLFEKTKMDLHLTFNQQQKIIGIFFLPPKSSATYNVPDYYQAHKLYESKVTLKSGKYELPGILCMPNNSKNPPVAILLAGSGPNDKDETVGPNKLLKDLALGLASKGVASFRYDKRTLTYGKEMAAQNSMGIREEVIDDALSAIAMIRANPLTKNSKVYVIGHSLGAMCAPWIASKGKADGVVLLAGNARPLEDLIVDQYQYLYGTEKSDNADPEVKAIREKASLVKDKQKLNTANPEELPLGLPAPYWQSLASYHQTEVARKLKQPVLVLQGERDYQVTMTEFELWKKALGGQAKNKFISYPALNHLLMKGEGKSMPSEYEQPNHVDEAVINDIVEWINTRP